MALANLEIDLLRSFAAVADSGGFTAAAGLVARTQSAVSMQIRRLEEAVGHRLLDRNPRALALTPQGEALLDSARRILALHDETVRRLAAAPVTGTVRLGVTEYFVPNELPSLLARFAASHPGVQLEVRMGLSRDLRQELHAGRLDAALVRLEGEAASEALWREPQVWVVAEAWREPGEGPVPLVVLPRGCVLRDFAIQALERRHRPWHLAYTGSSMASVQAAVRAGLGVSIMARSSVLEGMRVLSAGRRWPNPGTLSIGLLEAKGAPAGVAEALRASAQASLARVRAPAQRG